MTIWSESDLSVNGISIHYYRGGNAHKPPLLLLHGISDNGLCWSRVAHALADNYDIVMPDARGHGKSEGIATGFSLPLLTADAVGVCRELHLEKPVLFGHSMGALTAAQVASSNPTLARSLVLEDPPLHSRPPVRHPSEDEPAKWQREMGDLLTLPRTEQLALAFTRHPDWSEEETIPWLDAKMQFRPEVMTYRLSLFERSWREIIPYIICPILLLTGMPARGALVTPDLAREVVLSWQNGQAKYINGAGHSIHRDRFAETMAAVQTFLRSSQTVG